MEDHNCAKPACKCKPIRILRDQCLQGNPEDKCQDWVNAFKQCVEEKKREREAQ
jgi:hypothetical protein